MAKEIQKEVYDSVGYANKVRFYVLRGSRVVMLDTRVPGAGAGPHKRYPSNEQAVKALAYYQRHGFFPAPK